MLTATAGVSGALAVVQADQFLAGSGVVGLAGALAVVQADQVLAGSGVAGLVGALAVVQAGQVLTVAASVTDPAAQASAERAYPVPAEPRTVAVRPDNRTAAVPAEPTSLAAT